jgi:MFS family permease
MVSPLLPLYFYMKFSAGPEMLGPFYALSRFISMFSYLFVDKMVSIVGEVGSIVFSRLISLFGIILLPFAPNYYVGAALLVLFRTVALFAMPVRQSFITLIVDPSESASAVGISNLARMSVRSLAPALAGYIFENISLSLPFFLGGFLVGLNALLYRLFFGNSSKRMMAPLQEKS